MPASESLAHVELKRLALVWAQANGYSVIGTEVSLPNLRFRLDAAAYRPGAIPVLQFDETRCKSRWVNHAAFGATVIFECKAYRSDLIRDCRISLQITEKIKALSEARDEMEKRMKISSPSLLNGDALWPEYETLAVERCDDPAYLRITKMLKTLRHQNQAQTKMENLFRWNAANLHYLVVEPGIIHPVEIPSGWGLLVRNEGRLDLLKLPEFQPLQEQRVLNLLHLIAAAASKSVNRDLGVRYELIEAERRGTTYNPIEPSHNSTFSPD